MKTRKVMSKIETTFLTLQIMFFNAYFFLAKRVERIMQQEYPDYFFLFLETLASTYYPGLLSWVISQSR